MSRFKTAVREQTSLIIGLFGPSWSGKTKSALRLATGLTGGDGIFMVDTEGGRGLHYAEEYKYQYASLEAPFRPERYMEILLDAKAAGAKCIIVDSLSHEHEGPGGILEWHEEELTRMAGTDFGKREKMKFTAWIKPKAAHNKFVNAVLQLGIHLIVCFRAKEKLALLKNPQTGKIEPVPQGWQAICPDRFEFECTALLLLPPGSQGIPDLSPKTSKLQDQHKPLVPDGEQISEAMGKRLAEWAAGGGAPGPLAKLVAEAPTAKAAGKSSKSLTLILDGGEARDYPKASDWLAALKSALEESHEGQPAGQLWDQNAEVFASIQTSVEGMKDGANKSAARDMIAAVAALAHERTKVFRGKSAAALVQGSFTDEFVEGRG